MRTASITGLAPSGAAVMDSGAATCPTPVPAAAPVHRRDIQGLRAVAVLLVALGHAGMRFLPGGFVGVDVFFVLSGFLITGLLLAEARTHGSVSLLDFYVRRARRILPAAALTLLVTNVGGVLRSELRSGRAGRRRQPARGRVRRQLPLRGTQRRLLRPAPSRPRRCCTTGRSRSRSSSTSSGPCCCPLRSSAWHCTDANAPRHVANGDCWRSMLLLVLASLAYSIRLTATAPTDCVLLAVHARLGARTRRHDRALRPDARAHPGSGGRSRSAGRVWWRSASPQCTFSEETAVPRLRRAPPDPRRWPRHHRGDGCGAITPGRRRALLSLRPMFVVGDRSYAFYLWHWPVLILAGAYAGHELSVPVKLGFVAGAFALACLSYALVENPIRHRVRSRRTTGLVDRPVHAPPFLGTAAVSLRRDQSGRRSASAARSTAGTGRRAHGRPWRRARRPGHYPPSSPPSAPRGGALPSPPASPRRSASSGELPREYAAAERMHRARHQPADRDESLPHRRPPPRN